MDQRHQQTQSVGGLAGRVGLRRQARSPWLAALVACLLLASVIAMNAPAPATSAPVFSYFPSPSATDGRMLSIAGNNLSTLGGNTVTLSFSVANSATNFQLGFFDGDDKSVWDADQTTNFPTRFELYEDPLGNGSGTVLVATWTEADMLANAWKDFAVNTSPSAKSPSGNYFYRLTVRGTTTNATYNNFKVRVEGATYITPVSIFGLMAAKASGITTAGAYNGEWDFSMVVPNGATYVGCWDGDFDYGPSTANGDTNDPNTPSTIPTWSPSSAQAEGAKGQGSPPDDNTDANLRRSPNINYEIIRPDGTTFQNMNPSGTTEWEYFRLDTAAFNSSVMDYHVDSLPAGVYHIHIRGMDWRNLCAMKFDYPIVGQDSNGDPLIPPAPFTVGDLVWNDVVPDGVRSPSETGVAGVKVRLTDAVSGAIVGTATTDATGLYSMTAWNGSYWVTLDPTNFDPGGPLYGWSRTTATTQTINVVNANISTADFGVRLTPRVTVTPDQAASAGPGDTLRYGFTVQNNGGSAGIFDLSTLSTLGWSNVILNGSGMPTSSVSLAAGESTTVAVQLIVPMGATIGSRDVTRLTATLRGDPSGASGSAIAETTVRQAVDISPDNADSTGAGTSIDYSHTVVNGSSATQTVNISVSDEHGWPAGIYAANGTTPISSVALPPNGGSAQIVVRVSVPAGTAKDTTDTATVTASVGALSDTARDVTTVGGLLVYPNASYTAPASTFALGDKVYGRATGLTSGTQYYFVWKNPSGTIRYTSANIAANASGVATDTYTSVPTDVVGGWTVELHRASNGAIIDTRPFTLNYVAAISALYATDAATIGSATNVTSAEDNSSITTITASTLTYRIWWDSNGNSSFDSGDVYIGTDGRPVTWTGSGSAVTHTTSGVTVPPFTTYNDPGWQMSNVDFPNQGTYNLTATWTSSTGFVIDERTTQFFSVPTFGEIVAKLTTPSVPLLVLGGLVWIGALAGLHRRRRWLSFYALGALGTVLMALFAAQIIGLDQWLETMEARQVAAIAHSLQINVSFLPPSGLTIQNHVGWGVFDVGIECSALLEMAAFAGLVAFYPGFNALRKTYLVIAGVMATYVINIFRILIIVDMIAQFGTGSVFIAHAVVGRLFFFTGIVVVYWVLVTMPTVRVVFARLQPAPAEGGSHE